MDTNYLLIGILVLFLILVVRGYRKGFLRIAVYFAGIVFILLTVKSMSPSVSKYLMENTNAYTNIKEGITDNLKEKNSILDNSIAENQKLTIDSYDMPDLIKDRLNANNTIETYKTLLVVAFEEYVSSYLAKTAINALSFIGLFIVLWIVFRIVLHICDLISKIPVIKGLNKMLGALLGFAEALVLSWLFFFVVLVFMGNTFWGKIIGYVNDSFLLRLLFNSNILMYFL